MGSGLACMLWCLSSIVVRTSTTRGVFGWSLHAKQGGVRSCMLLVVVQCDSNDRTPNSTIWKSAEGCIGDEGLL